MVPAAREVPGRARARTAIRPSWEACGSGSRPCLGSLGRLDLRRKRSQPFVKGAISVHDDFEFSVRKSPDDARPLRRERDFDPFAIETERVRQFQNAVDLCE